MFERAICGNDLREDSLAQQAVPDRRKIQTDRPQWTLGQSKEKAKAKRVNSKGKTDKGEGKGKIQQQQWNQAWQTQTQTWDPKYASDKGDDKPGKHKGNTLVLL
jgi:hypothetical protein